MLIIRGTYKASRNQVTNELRKARKVFEEKLAQGVKDNPVFL